MGSNYSILILIGGVTRNVVTFLLFLGDEILGFFVGGLKTILESGELLVSGELGLVATSLSSLGS